MEVSAVSAAFGTSAASSELRSWEDRRDVLVHAGQPPEAVRVRDAHPLRHNGRPADRPGELRGHREQVAGRRVEGPAQGRDRQPAEGDAAERHAVVREVLRRPQDLPAQEPGGAEGRPAGRQAEGPGGGAAGEAALGAAAGPGVRAG